MSVIAIRAQRAPVHQDLFDALAEMQPRDILIWDSPNVRSTYESARKRLERLGYEFKLWEHCGRIWVVRMA